MCIYLSRTIYTYVRCIMYMCLLNTHTWFHLYGLSVEGASKGSRVVPWIKLKEINQPFKTFYDIVFHIEQKRMGNTCQIILYTVPVFCLEIFVVMYYLISFLRAESWSLYMASSPQFDTACSLPRTILMAILTPLICNIHVYPALSV